MIHKNRYAFIACIIFHQLFSAEFGQQAPFRSSSLISLTPYFRTEKNHISQDAPEKPLDELLENNNADFFSALAQTFNQESSPPVERFAKQILKHASSKPNDNCQDDDEYRLLTTIGEEAEHKHNPHCQICKFRVYTE
jgi:hypothetical protein